jgi:hypothetical protein
MPRPRPMWRPPLSVVLALVIGTALKLWLAATTYGSNDVYAYERFAIWGSALGVDIYHAAWDFNHPAMMVHVLRGLELLSAWSGWSFAWWLRSTAALADVGTLLLTGALLADSRESAVTTRALMLAALAPVMILVAGYHGNTDSLMLFLVVAAIWLAERERSPVLVGGVLGLAMGIKIVPIILVPAFFLHQPWWGRRAAFTAALAGTMLLTWLPFIAQDPVVIAQHVLGYRSLDGIWGLPYLWQMLAPPGSTLRAVVAAIPLSGAVWLVLGCGLLTLWMQLRLRDRPRLFAQVGAVFALFLTCSSGFGVQYLLGLVPFTVALGSVPALLFHVTTGAFVFAVYDYWAGGRPWYLSDSNLMGPWPSAVEPMQVTAWIATTGVLLLFVRWVREGAQRGVRPTFAPDGLDGPGARGLVAAVVAFVLITSTVRTREVQRTLTGPHARMSPAAVQTITIEHHLRLAEWMAARGDLRGALAVAERAAAMDSTSRAAAITLLRRTLAVGDRAGVRSLSSRIAAMPELSPSAAATWRRP